LNDKVITKAYIDCRKFFSSPVENPVGIEYKQILSQHGGSLVPDVYNSVADIQKHIGGWYSQ
jgi:hypothetical protein